ncbi:cupin domain-containing protein [Aquimarina gracilis]|uniref:Cupin domain-containing protein n=1 Tax=Aquimarina gracilis TaxID=874422 RepID=A0ABU5ZXW6_9FLAO|nr:cupin domain-containing protein [Aquimarina gracilis]MEB3346697.1 cupin domain-containing protein [Aquimarina gracilis]
MKTFKNTIVIVIHCLLTSNIIAGVTSRDFNKKKLSNQIEYVSYNEAEEIIVSYVNDYKSDRFASEVRTVGIEVPDYGTWSVIVTGKKLSNEWEVVLKKGLPTNPTYVYKIEFETLKAIYNREINALTAQGKAFSGDYTPMSVWEMEGFTPSPDDDSKLNAFSFHFWTKGFPEIIPFREGTTRKAHGSNFTVFYYEKGLRTAWYRILPGEKVRDDAREQAAPFPMLGVTIKGTIEGKVDGKRITVAEGNTVFIPANVAHKWWNDKDEVVEVVLIMFGKGA